jgi:hypothetical protein
MQYTHPRLVLTCSTAPIHTYVESSSHHLHSHTLVLNLHKLTCTHTHLSWILYAVSHALSLSLSLTCTHSLHSLELRYLGHCAIGTRFTEGNILQLHKKFPQTLEAKCAEVLSLLWTQCKEVPWFMAITVLKNSHFCCSLCTARRYIKQRCTNLPQS